MTRPTYLSDYSFDWELFDVVFEGSSAMDTKSFIGTLNDLSDVSTFLRGYGLGDDPVTMAELFGSFHESIQFIKRYFLKEGNPLGLDLTVPNSFYGITDIGELFIKATIQGENNEEERLWAEAILKVMHIIIHIDKDIRSSYFSIIQTQIFDKLYKHIYRDENEQLFLGNKKSKLKISLIDFTSKATKSRDSMIIKLLHKPGSVSEEIYDRVGVRFITENKFDVLRVVKFLLEKHIIIPHNIIPQRSLNTIINLKKFKKNYSTELKGAIKNGLDEEKFLKNVDRAIKKCNPIDLANVERKNEYTSDGYLSTQFTARQLITYKNPITSDLSVIRKLAKEDSESELAKKVLSMDTSKVTKEVNFFFPFEVQVVDQDSYSKNNEGKASHRLYKRNQKQAALVRVFKKLIDYKGIDLKSLQFDY